MPTRPLPVDIVVVNTAEELRRAIAAAARDIEIRSHIDLRGVGNPDSGPAEPLRHGPRGYLPGRGEEGPAASSHREFAAITWPTRSIRVRSLRAVD